MRNGRGARIVRRTFGLGLAVGAVTGIAVFTPPHAAPTITAAVAPLSQAGFGADDPLVEKFIANLRTVSAAEVAEDWANAGPEGQKKVRATFPPQPATSTASRTGSATP